MRTNTPLIALSLAALLTGAACRGKADAPPTTSTPPATTATALAVSGIDVGRTLNPDKTIGDNTATFKPMDTIYVSVATNGTSSGANLSARFTYGADGQVVKDESRQIAPSGAATDRVPYRKTRWLAGGPVQGRGVDQRHPGRHEVVRGEEGIGVRVRIRCTS